MVACGPDRGWGRGGELSIEYKKCRFSTQKREESSISRPNLTQTRNIVLKIMCTIKTDNHL